MISKYYQEAQLLLEAKMQGVSKRELEGLMTQFRYIKTLILSLAEYLNLEQIFPEKEWEGFGRPSPHRTSGEKLFSNTQICLGISYDKITGIQPWLEIACIDPEKTLDLDQHELFAIKLDWRPEPTISPSLKEGSCGYVLRNLPLIQTQGGAYSEYYQTVTNYAEAKTLADYTQRLLQEAILTEDGSIEN